MSWKRNVSGASLRWTAVCAAALIAAPLAIGCSSSTDNGGGTDGVDSGGVQNDSGLGTDSSVNTDTGSDEDTSADSTPSETSVIDSGGGSDTGTDTGPAPLDCAAIADKTCARFNKCNPNLFKGAYEDAATCKE